MTDVLEEHDKSAFETHAYYCGIDRIDPTRTRIRESVDSWFEINGLTDEQAAARIREDQIDILLAMRSLTCSWIHFLMARTRPPLTRCGWAYRS